MIKACWDCLAGDQQRQADDRYSVHVNGTSNNQPWPIFNSNIGKMFAVPTQIKENNHIMVKGIMTNESFDIGLRTDDNPSNVVCQVICNRQLQQIALRTVLNGNIMSAGEFNSEDFFYDETFDVTFSMSSSEIRVQIGELYLQHVQLRHSVSDIRYISVIIGEVKELIFKF